MDKNRLLRLNLTSRKITYEHLDPTASRKYIGSVGLGAHILYREIPITAQWNNSENHLIIAAGPLNGTLVAGLGSFCVITKGAITNGATST